MNCTGFPLDLQGPTATMKDISFGPSLPAPANCAATQKLGTGLAGSAPTYRGCAARNELSVTTDGRPPVRRPPHQASPPPGKPGIVLADVPRGGNHSPSITGSVFARCRIIHAAPGARKTANALRARQVARRIDRVFVAWRQLDRPGCRPSASQSRQLRQFGGAPASCITLTTAVGKVFFGEDGAVGYRLLTCAAQLE